MQWVREHNVLSKFCEKEARSESKGHCKKLVCARQDSIKCDEQKVDPKVVVGRNCHLLLRGDVFCRAPRQLTQVFSETYGLSEVLRLSDGQVAANAHTSHTQVRIFTRESQTHTFGSEIRMIGSESRTSGSETHILGPESRMIGSEHTHLNPKHALLDPGSQQRMVGSELSIIGSEENTIEPELRRTGWYISPNLSTLEGLRHSDRISLHRRVMAVRQSCFMAVRQARYRAVCLACHMAVRDVIWLCVRHAS